MKVMGSIPWECVNLWINLCDACENVCHECTKYKHLPNASMQQKQTCDQFLLGHEPPIENCCSETRKCGWWNCWKTAYTHFWLREIRIWMYLLWCFIIKRHYQIKITFLYHFFLYCNCMFWWHAPLKHLKIHRRWFRFIFPVQLNWVKTDVSVFLDC